MKQHSRRTLNSLIQIALSFFYWAKQDKLSLNLCVGLCETQLKVDYLLSLP